MYRRTYLLVLVFAGLLLVYLLPAQASMPKYSNSSGTQTIFYNPVNGHVVYRGRFRETDRAVHDSAEAVFEYKKGRSWHRVKRVRSFWTSIGNSSFRLDGHVSARDRTFLKRMAGRRPVRLSGVVRGIGLNHQALVDFVVLSKIQLKPLPIRTRGMLTTNL